MLLKLSFFPWRIGQWNKQIDVKQIKRNKNARKERRIAPPPIPMDVGWLVFKNSWIYFPTLNS